MEWDESDTNLKSEWDKSIARQRALDLKSREERKLQQSINALRMVEKRETEEVEIKGTPQKVTVINFYLPKNFAGNEMDSDYRDAQKIALIENNNNRLNEQ